MSLSHRLTRMTGRDPDETHRAATPLELLFDLTFVVAFSQAGTQAAHLLELGDTSSAVIAFSFAVFAVSWAWINYSWLASAYDTDDIFFRIATLIAMVGVLIVALGIPPLFHSIAEGAHVDNAVIVAGYVVMRVATIALWLRVAAHDPLRRRTALAYVVNISIAQVGWIVAIFVNMPIAPTLAFTCVLVLFELAGPIFAEKRFTPTPWHPHHIAERYGLLVIITLGEVILGTILSVSAVIEAEGWSAEAILIAFGGTTLAFAMWWVYFMLPSGTVLARHPGRGFVWGYGHIVLFGSIAAVGAGLHVAANVIAHDAHVDATFALLCVAIPVLAFEVVLFTLYWLLLREFDVFLLWLLLAGIALLAVGVIAIVSGASIGVALLIVACSPVALVVGYEAVGYRREEAALARDVA